MSPLDRCQGQVVTTTSPRFSQHSTGFQYTREWCSRLWCWCGSVLTALLPATSLNSVFPLPLLQVVHVRQHLRSASTGLLQVLRTRSMIGQRSFAVARPSLWSSLPAALRRPEMSICTFKRHLKPICSTSDVLANRMIVRHRPALLWRFRDSGAGNKTAALLTYLLTYLFLPPWLTHRQTDRQTDRQLLSS